MAKLNIFKKFITIVFTFIIFFSSTSNINAEILTIESVIKELEKNEVIEWLKESNDSLLIKNDTRNSKINIEADNEIIFSFAYKEDYIEYDNRNAIVTEENCMENLNQIIWIKGLIESIFTLSGHNNKTISENIEELRDSYNEYGLQFESEHFQYSGQEEGSSWNISGEYIKYFKISLDTDKIDKFAEKYSVNIDAEETNDDFIKSIIPTTEVKDITETSVTIYAKVNNSTNVDQNINCYIYRSESENGIYEKISDKAVNCTQPVGLVDKDLKSDTTYYYKSIIDGGKDYSETIKVTTKKAEISSEKNDITEKEEIENPKTGINISTISVILMIIGVIVIYNYTKKINNFKKI